MKTLALENKGLLWAFGSKSGALLKRGGQVKSWKKRQFILKDSYLFYFKVLSRVEQTEPAGVIPLQGCKVGHVPSGSQTSVENVFVITLPDELVNLGIVKRTNYALAAHTYEESQEWIDLIQMASISRRKLRGRIEHAQMEVNDLEKRWEKVKARDSTGANKPLPKFDGKEDPLLLQAIADDLMMAYHIKDLLLESIEDGSKRVEEASSHLGKLERSAAIQEEMVMSREDMGFLMEGIEGDMNICSESLEWLIPARFLFHTIQKQVEALEGLNEVCGDNVPSLDEIEIILRFTLLQIKDLEYNNKGTEILPDENSIVTYSNDISSIYKDYMSLIEAAININDNYGKIPSFGSTQPPQQGMIPNIQPSQQGIRPSMPPPQQGMRPSMPPPQQGMRPSMPPPQQGMRSGMPTPQQGMRPNMSPPQQAMRPNMPPPQQGMRPRM